MCMELNLFHKQTKICLEQIHIKLVTNIEEESDIKDTVINHIKINKGSVLNKPIAVRYLIKDIII